MPAKKSVARKAPAKKAAEKAPEPSKPIVDEKVAANQTQELPQPTKKAAAKKDDDSSKLLPVEEVAELLLDGATRWGTGRDRDTNLEQEGYDLDEVRNAVTAARGKRLNPN